MQDIHDIRPPVRVGLDPMLLKQILMAVAGMVLLAALFFWVKQYLKKRNQPKDLKCLPEPMPPYAAALKALDFLFQSEIADLRLFYFDLTGILRHYMGQSFGMNALEMTSQEFIKSLNGLDLDKGVKKEITGFQSLCDPFKYAGEVPGKDQAAKDLAFVREKIHQIEKDLEIKKDLEKNQTVTIQSQKQGKAHDV